jgi:hypothetical protein
MYGQKIQQIESISRSHILLSIMSLRSYPISKEVEVTDAANRVMNIPRGKVKIEAYW